MPLAATQWQTLERNRHRAFLVAAAMFAIDALIVAGVMTTLGEDVMLLGQAFIAVAWTAAFVGALGVYPSLASATPRLAKAAAVCVTVGIVVFVVMAIASVAYFGDLIGGGIEALVPIFLPGVFIGSVLGFLLLGAATLRTDVESQSVGALFVILGLFPVVNIGSGAAGYDSMAATLAIVSGLVVVTLAIGTTLRGGAGTEEAATGAPREPAA